MTDAKLWNYSLNGRPSGPVDGATLGILISQGILDVDTLIWQEGMKEWLRIGDSPFASALREKTKKTSGLQPIAVNVPAAQPVAVIPNLKLRPGSLKTPYICWLVLFGLNLAVTMFSAYRIILETYSLYIWARFVVSLLAAIPMLILFGRCWKIAQDGTNDIRPREAVGLLFVPGYHLYWFVKAFLGLSNSLNRFIGLHLDGNSSLRRSNTALVLGYCVIALFNIIFSAFFYIYIESRGFYYSDFTGITILFILFILAYLGVTIAAMTDFYLTSKGILEERKGSNM